MKIGGSMKTIISLTLSLVWAATSFAAADAARVEGYLKVKGIHFANDGSTIYSSNELLKNKGAWSGSSTYSAGDVVQSQGTSYVGIIANQNSLPPNSNWTVLAAQGAQGVPGSKGDKGDAGTPACNSTKWVITGQAIAWEYNSVVGARNRSFIYDTTGKLIGSFYISPSSSRLVTCSSYDTFNNPILCKYYYGDYKVVYYTYYYTYGIGNNIISKEELAKDSLGNFEWSTVYNYDSNGNLVSEIAHDDISNPSLLTDTTTYTNIYESNEKAIKAKDSHPIPN